jgi:hypothetical protein
MKTELVPGAHKIDSLELIKAMIRKQKPFLSDELINNLAQGVMQHLNKGSNDDLIIGDFWDDVGRGLTSAWNAVTSAVNTVVDTVDEFATNISFKNALNPSKWRADPVKKAVARLEKGANELGEIISIPDWLDEVIEYTSYAVGTGLTVIGLPMVGSAVIVGGRELAKAVDALDKVENNVKAINNAVSEVSETIEETEQTLTSLKDNLKEYDFSLDEIINNANNFENKINSAVDKMTIFSDTAKTDLKNFISSEAEISKMTGALPMDIKDLLDGINTAPAELQEKLSAGIKAINARAESAIRMAQGVETLQANFIKLGKEAKQKAEENLKLVESIKTDAATNKYNLDEIKLANYKTDNKIRIYRQLLSDKNQIIKRLTADVGEVKTYIADKTTMATDEIEDLTAKIQELEDSLDYVYSIVSDELEDLL